MALSGKRFLRPLKRLAAGCFLAILSIVLMLLLLDRSMVFWAGYWISSDSGAIVAKDVILVPGARIYAGEVSAILGERLDAAIELYEAKKAPRILASGDYSSRYYDEASAMSRYLQQHGVGSGDIVLDHAGFSTYDSLYRAKSVFGFTKVIVASQGFHLPRSLFIARSLGIDAVGFDASRIRPKGSVWWHNAWREPLARIKAVYDVLRGAKPAFEGLGLPPDGAGHGERE